MAILSVCSLVLVCLEHDSMSGDGGPDVEIFRSVLVFQFPISPIPCKVLLVLAYPSAGESIFWQQRTAN